MRFDRFESYFYVIISTALAPAPSVTMRGENGRGINESYKSRRHIDIRRDVSSDDTRSYLQDSKMRIYCGRSTARDFV